MVRRFKVPRTIYELFCIREYLRERAHTPFIHLDSPEECMEEGLYMGCGQVWYWDHKTWPQRGGRHLLTEDAFRARAREFIEDPHQCFVHYEVNCRLLDFIAASPCLPPSFFSSTSPSTDGALKPDRTGDSKTHHASQIPSCCSHQLLHAQAPFSHDSEQHGCWLCVMEDRLGVLLKDLELEGSGGELARLYEEWPLRLPAFEERLQEWCRTTHVSHAEDAHDECQDCNERTAVKMVYRQYVKPDIDCLRKVINQYIKLPQPAIDRANDVHRFLCALMPPALLTEHDGAEHHDHDHGEMLFRHSGMARGRARVPHATAASGQTDDGPTRSDRERYDFILNALYPKLRFWASVDCNLQLGDWKDLKRHLSPVAVVDPCVHSFTKPGYLERKDIIYESLHLELGLERRRCHGSDEPAAQLESEAHDAERASCGSVDEEDDNGWLWPAAHAHKESVPGKEGAPEPEGAEFFLLYRGSRGLRHDSPVLASSAGEPASGTAADKLNPARAHSLSYGLGLFAGVMQDSSATPFNYMRKRGMQAYAVKIPHDASASPLARRLFFVPPLPAVAMLRGLGELFHPRSRVCLETRIAPGPSTTRATRASFVSGILACSYASLPPFLETDEAAVAAFSAFVSAHAHLLDRDDDDDATRQKTASRGDAGET